MWLRRRTLLAGAGAVLAARTAEAHDPGGGGGAGDGGGGDAGIWVELYGRPIQPAPPGFYTPAGTPLPAPPTGLAAGTADILAPLTPQERAEWEAAAANLEATLWGYLETVARGLNWLGEWTQYGLNFVPGISGINTALTGGRGFADAYAKALGRGASQADAIKAGLTSAIVAAGLDRLAGKLSGKATDHTFKNARDAVNTMKQRGLVPKMVVKGTVNTVGYAGTVATVEKGKELAQPVVVSGLDQLTSALSKALSDPRPPAAGGYLPGQASVVPVAR